MPRYLVERHLRAGLDCFLADRPVSEIVAHSNEADVVWLHSYVTDTTSRMFCLCEAASPEAIRRAAHRTGLPVDLIHRVTVLEPHAFVQVRPPPSCHAHDRDDA
jgi:hypothetical protein